MATMTLDKTIMMPLQTVAAADENQKMTTAVSTKAQEVAAPKQTHTVPSMAGISQELRREICEHLSKKDLINVCLTSKIMQDAAVPALYRNISLKVADCRKTALEEISSMLSRENPGIDYIQSVHLVDWCHPKTSCTHTTDKALAATRYLINALPKDKLKSFSWDSSHGFTPELSILLLKRQRNMKHIELHATSPCMNDAFRADMSVLKSVEKADSLHFEPSCKNCLEGASMVLQRAKSIQKLKLSGFCLNDPWRQITTDEEGVISDLVFTTLFGHLKEPGAQPMQLTSLSLDLVDLTECKVNYANVIQFETLKKLRLRNCWRPDLFLDCMMHPNHGRATRLDELVIGNDEDEDQRLLNSTLDRFLRHQKGLKNLQLYLLNNGSLPTLENIIWHGDTLEKLFVCVRQQPRDPSGNHESYTAPEQLSQLCAAMPQLKQLALSISEWPVSMDCKLHKDQDYFKENILGPLARLPKLQTLNVLNWPKIGCGCPHLDMSDTTYRVLMRAQATEFFRLFKEAQASAQSDTKSDTLRVLAFGEHKDFVNSLKGLNEDDQSEYLKRHIFYRMQGKEKWTDAVDAPLAVSVEPEDLEQIEVETDIVRNWFKFRPSWGQTDDW